MSNQTIISAGSGLDDSVDRRAPRPAGVLSPERLMLHQIEQTRRQLDGARGQLVASRRRVAQLEQVERNWEELASTLSA